MRTKRTQKGVTLFEVLITVFVLSIGLLGHSKIQALGVRANADANMRTQATYLLSEMMERIRANRPSADSNYYSSIDYASINCSAAPAKICTEGTAGSAVECSTSEIADEDAIHWFCDVQATMPRTMAIIISTSVKPFSCMILS